MLTGLGIADLAESAKVDLDFLDAIVDRRSDPYESARLAKRSGGYRYIDLPEGRLAHFQRHVLREYLDDLPLHPAAYGFVRGKSAVKCASRHLGARWLLRIDLREFFPSIDERDVYHVLRRNLHADRLTGFQLARLLTRSGGVRPVNREVRGRSEYSEPHLAYGRLYGKEFPPATLGYLPQGAPSSGAIANLAAGHLDVGLTGLARDHRLLYTRYADDLHFSSHTEVSRAETRKIVSAGYRLIRQAGFQPNLKKTRVFGRSITPTMLGLHIDGSHLRLRRSIREEIDETIRALERFGLVAHAAHRKQDEMALLARAEGLVSFARGVDPAWSRPRRDSLRRIVDAHLINND